MVNLHYIPVHTQPYYQEMGFRSGDFPEAEKYYSEAISIPLFPTLTEPEQDFVVESLKEAMAL
jgi:dTDP-4-amino-4,6-dideoxygalactose transaminase